MHLPVGSFLTTLDDIPLKSSRDAWSTYLLEPTPTAYMQGWCVDASQLSGEHITCVILPDLVPPQMIASVAWILTRVHQRHPVLCHMKVRWRSIVLIRWLYCQKCETDAIPQHRAWSRSRASNRGETKTSYGLQ